MIHRQIDISQEQLAAFCQRHRIRKLSLFGSILRDHFSPESDVDFLVEFDADAMPGLFAMADMELELSEMLGRKADLRTAEDLSRYFRNQVVQDAALQYAS
jgi:predicted nucleotidyltransferase